MSYREFVTKYRRLKAASLYLFRKSWRRRGYWLRGLFCWAIGIVIYLATASNSYDQRFQIRGQQQHSNDAVLIHISQEEWTELFADPSAPLKPLKEISTISDSYFWQEDAWPVIIETILKNEAKAIGVSFYFGDNLRSPSQEVLDNDFLNDPRVIWASRLDSGGRVLTPIFSRYYSLNTGLNEVKQDTDGLVRSFNSTTVQVPNIALRLAQRISDKNISSPLIRERKLINYRGRAGTFSSISLSQLVSGDFPNDFFKGKIVLIGSRDVDGHTYRTPVGEMTRVEVLANIIENIRTNQWVSRVNIPMAMAYLLLLSAVAAWIMSTYPQFVALVFLIWIGAGTTALSLWIFDKHFLWLPIASPIGILSTAYVTFLSFRLTIRDYENWRLEHESKTLEESEKLKNNFVSLISHDLKTPIAKIQAICDRLLAQGAQSELAEDLAHLRRESSQLHRYIQTILQITRVESRNFKINKDAADINEIAEQVIRQVRPLAKLKSIEIDTKLEPMFLVEFDAVLIHEVILNLLENAVKYTQAGGGIIVQSSEVKDHIILEVIDNGPGIPEEEQSQVFDKFYRSDAHATAKGSGLGLYLVKYFIELHGGKVFVDSTHGKGTKVGFKLPIQEESITTTYPESSVGGLLNDIQ